MRLARERRVREGERHMRLDDGRHEKIMKHGDGDATGEEMRGERIKYTHLPLSAHLLLPATHLCSERLGDLSEQNSADRFAGNVWLLQSAAKKRKRAKPERGEYRERECGPYS